MMTLCGGWSSFAQFCNFKRLITIHTIGVNVCSRSDFHWVSSMSWKIASSAQVPNAVTIWKTTTLFQLMTADHCCLRTKDILKKKLLVHSSGCDCANVAILMPKAMWVGCFDDSIKSLTMASLTSWKGGQTLDTLWRPRDGSYSCLASWPGRCCLSSTVSLASNVSHGAMWIAPWADQSASNPMEMHVSARCNKVNCCIHHKQKDFSFQAAAHRACTHLLVPTVENKTTTTPAEHIVEKAVHWSLKGRKQSNVADGTENDDWRCSGSELFGHGFIQQQVHSPCTALKCPLCTKGHWHLSNSGVLTQGAAFPPMRHATEWRNVLIS